MTRVAQIGAAETSATYNRALVKTHARIGLADPENEGETVNASMLKTEVQISVSALCIGDKCAMWRWVPAPRPRSSGGYVPPIEPATHGYCGLAWSRAA